MPTYPVILITGASSGIGAATARLFAREGYRVAMAARRFDRLQALADEIKAGEGQALPIAADVSRRETIQPMVQAALEAYGQIDLLFNNAGFGRLGWLEALDPVKDIEDQLRVNALGLIHTTQAVLPHMIERRSGQIINMSSMAGWIATPTYSIYAASKFAVRGFTEALRREVGVWGIKVSVIYPGSVVTEFKAHAGISRKTGITTPAVLRLNTDQVARAVLSLARRPRPSLVLPGYMRLAVWANLLFPGLVDRIIEARFTRPERGL
jgi:short-subunit dehydrogenase